MSPTVALHVEFPAGPRDRFLALARPILIIPQLLLVGGPAFVFGLPGTGLFRIGAMGALGGLAWVCALIDWFAILFHEGPVAGLQPYKRLYLEWRARVLAYGAFLRDEYPPFGQGAYPVTLDLPAPPEKRDKVMVFFRLFLVLPHAVVLMLLLFAWLFVGIYSWIWLSVTGTLQEQVWRFSRDVMAYSLRVETYALLLHDEFPSFSLAQEPEPMALHPA